MNFVTRCIINIFEYMKKILIVLGTRPEAIKMAPLVKEFMKDKDCFDVKVCVTAQHREMLDQVLSFFDIKPDYDLDLMKPNQNLYTLTADIISGLKPILNECQPDFVFVHGDTTTTMATSIASFYNRSKVCHIEAGLRTFNKYSPFPEEINRQIVSRIADYHFAPTRKSKINLLNESISDSSILVTGNTVIDSLLTIIEKVDIFKNKDIQFLKIILDKTKKIILVTGHRRENHGQGFINICEALKEIAQKNENVQIVFPVHLNPRVEKTVYKTISKVKNIYLISPLTYPAFVWLMKKSYLVITDSGGVQEEAPSLGKPVLVTRNTTERPEAVDVGTVILVGTEKDRIVSVCDLLLKDEDRYKKMSALHNPYGDGNACHRIVKFIKNI